jgi:hypothetical protein
MNKVFTTTQHWSTSSFGSPPDTSPMELAELGEHVSRCAGQRGSLFALKCAGEALNEFLAPRLMTMLALFVLASVAATLMF